MASMKIKCLLYHASGIFLRGELADAACASLLYPQQIEPGNTMPDLGVSEQEASDMADYLYDPLTYWLPGDLLERKCSE